MIWVVGSYIEVYMESTRICANVTNLLWDDAMLFESLYLSKGMVLLKHPNESISSQGVAQDAEVSPRGCDIATTFRAW